LSQTASATAYPSTDGGANTCPVGSGPSYVATYNADNHLSGGLYAYDSAGDITADSTTGNSYLYDGEGRICAAKQSVGGLTLMTQYLYDADGSRVAKGTISTFSCDTSSNGFIATSVYVLGPGGEQLTEMTNTSATQTPNWQWAHTNAEAGGLSATYDVDSSGQTEGNMYFHLSDWLGTRRQQTDYAGNPVLNFTGLPYGDGLTTIPVSTADVADATEHHFTGKERDAESGNDYFGARYYSSSMGRFMSPDFSADPSPVPFAEFVDPQTLNLYSYGKNNPLRWVDPDGHMHQECTKSQTSSQDANGNMTITVSEHCTDVPDFSDWSYWYHPPTRAQIQAWGVASSKPGYWNNVPVSQDIMPWGMTGGLAGEISWSSKELAAIAKSLEGGATSVTVKTKSEAEELFLRLYQGDGYRNTTGMGATEAKQMFGEKAGTYHWDAAGEGHGPSNPHGASDHLQIHSFAGPIIRIFFSAK
jgi:RHS repeat-associated protein